MLGMNRMTGTVTSHMYRTSQRPLMLGDLHAVNLQLAGLGKTHCVLFLIMLRSIIHVCLLRHRGHSVLHCHSRKWVIHLHHMVLTWSDCMLAPLSTLLLMRQLKVCPVCYRLLSTSCCWSLNGNKKAKTKYHSLCQTREYSVLASDWNIASFIKIGSLHICHLFIYIYIFFKSSHCELYILT